MNSKSKAQEFADNVKGLAALSGNADEWEHDISPWTPVSQVVNLTCGRLDELVDTAGMADDEAMLARTAAGAIHAVCVVLDDLQERWYERHNPSEAEVGEGRRDMGESGS